MNTALLIKVLLLLTVLVGLAASIDRTQRKHETTVLDQAKKYQVSVPTIADDVKNYRQ